jgi:hypothetical protein
MTLTYGDSSSSSSWAHVPIMYAPTEAACWAFDCIYDTSRALHSEHLGSNIITLLTLLTLRLGYWSSELRIVCDVTPTAILNLLDSSVNFGSKFCASCRSNLRSSFGCLGLMARRTTDVDPAHQTTHSSTTTGSLISGVVVALEGKAPCLGTWGYDRIGYNRKGQG